LALRLKLLKSLSELDDIRAIWEELEQKYDVPRVLQSWGWCRVWLEEAAKCGANAKPSVRIVEDEAGRVLALLPFFESNLIGPLVRKIGFIGGQMSCHNDILISEPHNTELVDQVIELMRRSIGSRSILHLKNLIEGSLFTKRLLASREVAPMCTYLELARNPEISGQFGYMSKHGRKRMKNTQNKLKRERGKAFKVRSGAELPEALETLIGLHSKRYASKGERTLLVGHNLEFLRSIVKQMAEKFEIAELHSSTGAIASMLLLYDRRCCIGLQTGHDPDFALYSPMRLLFSETIRRSFEERDCNSYDLGPGYEAYKLRWAPSATWNHYSCIGGRGPYAKAMAAGYGLLWKNLLPQSYGDDGQRSF
jgi:CelD/BcsL family acetyltransferase involved in cellulose biosynthesis